MHFISSTTVQNFHSIVPFLSFLEFKIPGVFKLAVLLLLIKNYFAPYKSTLSLVSTYHLNMTNLSTKPNNIKKTFSKLHITLPQKTYQLTINVEFALKSCFSFHIFYADSFLPQMYYASVSQYFLT